MLSAHMIIVYIALNATSDIEEEKHWCPNVISVYVCILTLVAIEKTIDLNLSISGLMFLGNALCSN